MSTNAPSDLEDKLYQAVYDLDIEKIQTCMQAFGPDGVKKILSDKMNSTDDTLIHSLVRQGSQYDRSKTPHENTAEKQKLIDIIKCLLSGLTLEEKRSVLSQTNIAGDTPSSLAEKLNIKNPLIKDTLIDLIPDPQFSRQYLIPSQEAVKEIDISKKWLDLMPAESYFQNEAQSALPKADQSRLLANDKPELKALFQQIQDYHLIEKTREDSLFPRINALWKLKLDCDKLLNDPSLKIDPPQRQTLQDIISVCENKRNYLRVLTQLNTLTIMRGFSAEHTKEGMPLRKTLPYFYDFKDPLTGKGHIVKSDWIEKEIITELDPLHRHISPSLSKAWFDALEANTSISNFWLFLEDKDTSDMIQSSRFAMPLQSKQVIIATETNSRYPVCKNSEGNILNGHYLLSINKEGDLYIMEDIEAYNHNLVLNGDSVLFSGHINFDNGKIANMNGFSGHYQPSERHLNSALTILTKKIPSMVFNSDAYVQSWPDEVVDIHSFYKSSNFRDTIQAANSLSDIAIAMKHYSGKFPSDSKPKSSFKKTIIDEWSNNLNEMDRVIQNASIVSITESVPTEKQKGTLYLTTSDKDLSQSDKSLSVHYHNGTEWCTLSTKIPACFGIRKKAIEILNQDKLTDTLSTPFKIKHSNPIVSRYVERLKARTSDREKSGEVQISPSIKPKHD